jgi:hypothetical protein
MMRAENDGTAGLSPISVLDDVVFPRLREPIAEN